ncbi:hypothetical protein NDGK_01648 [Clostridiales bacterium CHKCI001]|nr:hypothetical protein NDGK_01648 [Clostridiales bacterium CHKCI001]
MNICFIVVCILIFFNSYSFLTKVIIGTVLCIIFAIIEKKKAKMYSFVRIIIVACFIASNFIYTYISSEYICLRNGIVIALLLNSIMSVYILCLMILVEKIKSILL